MIQRTQQTIVRAGTRLWCPGIERKPIWHSPLDTPANWTPVTNSVSADTANWLAGEVSFQSVKQVSPTGAGTGYMWRYFIDSGHTQDLTDPATGLPSHFVSRFKINVSPGASGSVGLFIAGASAQRSLWSPGSDYWQDTEKWRIVRRPIQNFTGFPANPNAVSYIRLYVNNTEGVAADVTFDWVGFVPTLAKGVICICLDDCPNQYSTQGAAYAASKGLRLSLACIGSYWHGDPTGTAMMMQLKRMGHLLCNHGAWHREAAGTTWAARRQDIEVNARWMLENGFGDGARIFVAPGGWKHDSDDRYLLGGLADQVRYTTAGGGPQDVLAAFGLREITTGPFDDATAAAATRATAIATKAIGVVGFHGSTYLSNPTNLAAFKTFVDQVSSDVIAGNVLCLTLPELLSLGA